jgi:hypothetical protein
VNSVENIVNFCKALDGKPLVSALCGMYSVILNEMKAVLKVSAQAEQKCVMNKPQSNQRPRTTTSGK